ncbi:MAG: histidine kinase [Balneolales bacterium]|nr:histidine kinase [Balneolales bacterium]
MLFGNSGGVFQFDGTNWKRIPLQGNRIVRALTKAKDGTIYLGSRSMFGYLAVNEVGEYYVQSISGDLGNIRGDIRTIIETEEGIFFQSDYEVYILRQGDIINHDLGTGLHRMFSFQGELIVQTTSGSFYKVNLEGFHALPYEYDFSDDLVFGIVEYDDVSWFLSRKSGAVRFQNGKFSAIETEFASEIASSFVYKAAKLSDGKMAIATLVDGLYITDRHLNKLEHFTRDNGLPTNAIYDLYEDDERSLWVPSERGIQRLQVTYPLRVTNAMSGIDGRVHLIADLFDKMYLSTTEGFFTMDIRNGGTEFKPYEIATGVIDILPPDEHRDFAYLSTVHGLFHYDGDNITRIKDFLGPILVRHDNVLFVRDVSVVYALDAHNNYEEIWSVDVNFEILKMVLFQNELWAHDNYRTLTRISLDGEVINTYTVDRAREIKHLVIIDERLLLSNNVGIFYYDESSDSLVIADFLGNNTIYNRFNNQIYQCDDIIYILTSNGFHRLKSAPDNSQIIMRRSYQEANHLSTSMICNEFGAWIGTTRGVYLVMDPYDDHDFTYKANFAGGIYVTGDSLVYAGIGRQPEVILPYNKRDITFNYSTSSYGGGGETFWETKLEGYDASFSGRNQETRRIYTNLSEGTYTFIVRTQTGRMPVGMPAEFTFTILPPWYRTWWAYLIYLVGVSGILYSAHTIRVNQILKVQGMRNRIASDLHDEVSATLSSISYFAEAVGRDDRVEEKKRFVELISASANDAKEKITDIVWAINPEHDDWKSFMAKCRRFASDLLESRDIKYQLRIDEEVTGKPDMLVRQHLWMIYKEIITNAVRHSQATQIDVILTVKGNQLELVVQDNGVGLPEKRESGNGLRNIKKRAESIGAKLTLDTEANYGTRFLLKLTI